MFRVDVPNIFSSGTDNSMDAGTQRKNSGQTNFVLETWWEKFRRSRVPNFFRSELGQDFREILEELGLKKTRLTKSLAVIIRDSSETIELLNEEIQWGFDRIYN